MEMSIEKAAKNDITGDALVSKPTGRKFDNNFDGIDWSETLDPNQPTKLPASQPKEKIMSWTATVEENILYNFQTDCVIRWVGQWVIV